jgi:ribosome biogenesis protein ERB1
MAPRALAPATGTSRLKRKRDSGPSAVLLPKPTAASTLEIDELGDDDAVGGSASGSDDEESNEEAFPEIDAGDDSDDANSVDEDGDETEGSHDGSYLIEDSDFVDSVDSEEDNPINTGPKRKTVLSKITGRPKRVYPEIEPNYNSDSSTEDVCGLLSITCQIH